MRFNEYTPLLHLGRSAEARAVLDECREVFERHHDGGGLGRVYSALANVEATLGHHGQAIAYERIALRYRYLVQDPAECAISHHNFGHYLEDIGQEGKSAISHRLAAAVIRVQARDGLLGLVLRNLAIDFAKATPDLPPLPASYDELCSTVEQVEGVRFRELFERLPRVAPNGDTAMRMVIEMAQAEVPKILEEITCLEAEQASEREQAADAEQASIDDRPTEGEPPA